MKAYLGSTCMTGPTLVSDYIEINDQLYALPFSPPGKYPGTPGMRSWVATWSSLEVLEDRNFLPLTEFEQPASPNPMDTFHKFMINSGGSLNVLVNGTGAIPQWVQRPAHQVDQLLLSGVKDMPTILMARYSAIRRNIYTFVRITSVETELLSVGFMKIRLLSGRMHDLVMWYISKCFW